MEMELANVVCIFTSPNEPGIKFYDRSPEPGSPEAKFAGSPKAGTFITDKYSISEATWDSEINIANGVQHVRYIDGAMDVITIIVSKEQMAKIQETIKNSKDTEIIIEAGHDPRYRSEDQNYEYFKQVRNEITEQTYNTNFSAKNTEQYTEDNNNPKLN